MPIDMSAAKAPPAKRATARKAAATPPPVLVVETTSINQERFKGLMGLASLGQGMCLMFGLHADAMTIGKMFPPIAAEVANIADDNETIAAPIDFLIKIGPYGGLLAALIPFGMQIAANHGWIDPTAAMGQGVVPPQVLEAQMKAEMMRMQAEALRAQQQAINEANAAAEAYAAMMQPAAAEASP